MLPEIDLNEDSIFGILIALITVFLFGYIGYFEVPHGDFFLYRDIGDTVLNLITGAGTFQDMELIYFFKMPFYPFVIKLISFAFFWTSSPFYSAQIFLSVLMFPLILLFSKKLFSEFIGKYLCIFAFLLLSLNPILISRSVKGIIDVVLLASVVIALVAAVDGSRKFWKSIVPALVRWEGVFILPINYAKEVISGGINKKYILALVSFVFPVLWFIFLWFSEPFQNIVSYLSNAFSLNLFFAGRLYSYLLFGIPPINTVFSVLFLIFVFVMSLMFFYRYRLKSVSVIGFFWIYMFIHIFYSYPDKRFILPILPLVILIIAVGLRSTFRRFFDGLGKELKNFSLLSFLVLLVSLLFLSRHKVVVDTSLTMLLFTVALISVTAYFIWSITDDPLQFIMSMFAACLIIFLSLQATAHSFQSIKYQKYSYKMAGEWLDENLNEGERAIVPEPWVVSHFSDVTEDRLLYIQNIGCEDISCLKEFVRNESIDYIVWTNGHHEFNSDYIDQAKLYLLDEIKDSSWEEISLIEEKEKDGFARVRKLKVYETKFKDYER